MNRGEVVAELRSLRRALVIASVDLTGPDERREMENRFAALVDYVNDMALQASRLYCCHECTDVDARSVFGCDEANTRSVYHYGPIPPTGEPKEAP